MADEQQPENKAPGLLPASEMINRELVQLALESYARALMYPNSEVQHDRANECRNELLNRLNCAPSPQPAERAGPILNAAEGEFSQPNHEAALAAAEEIATMLRVDGPREPIAAIITKHLSEERR